jgi:hypothetical protein
MIMAAIVMLGLCFMFTVTGTTIYLVHTRTQVEQTKRVELTEGTQRQAFESAWIQAQNDRDRIALETSRSPVKFDLDQISKGEML